jgi:hypothetical protein
MWSTDSHWFDVALVTSIIALGGTLFGRFEEHKPRWRRFLKVTIVTALLVGVSVTAGRGWMYALIGAVLAAVVAVHAWWLPRNGVNGWTAEPRERYYALLGVDPTAGRRRAP